MELQPRQRQEILKELKERENTILESTMMQENDKINNRKKMDILGNTKVDVNIQEDLGENMNLNIHCQPPMSTKQVDKARLGVKVIGKIDSKGLMRSIKTTMQENKSTREMNLDRIEKCKELKHVDMSALVCKGNDGKTTVLTMTSVFTQEVALEGFDQEKGQIGDGSVKISENEKQFKTVHHRKQNPQAHKPPGAQQRLKQKEDVVRHVMADTIMANCLMEARASLMRLIRMLAWMIGLEDWRPGLMVFSRSEDGDWRERVGGSPCFAH
jgi:hypothetical protein